MGEVLSFGTRQGLVEEQFNVAPQNTQMLVTVAFGTVPPASSFEFLIEQKLPGNDWSVVGGAQVINLATALGLDTSLTWRFSEQIVADVNGWESARDVQIAGNTYKQLAFRPIQRITVTTNTLLPYSVDVVTADVAPPAAMFPIIEER